MIKLTIPGRPVPAVRMTQKGKYVKKNAIRYLDYKREVAWVAKLNRVKPIHDDVAIEIHIYLAGGRQGDIDNYCKSIMDALNLIAYEDDRQVKRMVGEKRECGRGHERVEVFIGPYQIHGEVS